MGIIRDVKYTSNIIQNTGQGMETITVKLEDDNPLIPPKCSEVVVRIPAKYEQNLYDALGGAYPAGPTSREPDVVFTEHEAQNLPRAAEAQDVRDAMKNMNLQSKVKYVQWLAQVHQS